MYIVYLLRRITGQAVTITILIFKEIGKLKQLSFIVNGTLFTHHTKHSKNVCRF